MEESNIPKGMLNSHILKGIVREEYEGGRNCAVGFEKSQNKKMEKMDCSGESGLGKSG